VHNDPSGSSKVVDFGTNRKHVYPISSYWSSTVKTVTLVRSCPFPEILPFVDQNPPLPCPTPIPVKTSWSYLNTTGQTWIGLCSVLRPLQHSIGYMGDDVYRSKDPTNSIKVLKENLQRKKHKKT